MIECRADQRENMVCVDSMVDFSLPALPLCLPFFCFQCYNFSITIVQVGEVCFQRWHGRSGGVARRRQGYRCKEVGNGYQTEEQLPLMCDHRVPHPKAKVLQL